MVIKQNLIRECKKILKLAKKMDRLFCPYCKKFRSFINFNFYGKDFFDRKITVPFSSNFEKEIEKIYRFEGFYYTCRKCWKKVDSNILSRQTIRVSE